MQAKQAASSVSLLLIGGLLAVAATKAATATGKVEATIRSPAHAVADASTQLLVSSTAGVLTLSIPGGSSGSAPSTMTLTAGGSDASAVFSVSDNAGLAAVITQIATSGGTLSTSGALSGSGVQIVVLPAPAGGRGTVTAIVTYN